MPPGTGFPPDVVVGRKYMIYLSTMTRKGFLSVIKKTEGDFVAGTSKIDVTGDVFTLTPNYSFQQTADRYVGKFLKTDYSWGICGNTDGATFFRFEKDKMIVASDANANIIGQPVSLRLKDNLIYTWMNPESSPDYFKYQVAAVTLVDPSKRTLFEVRLED